MSAQSAIPPEFLEYVRNPLAEDLTVELFEDLHHVLDQYIVAITRGQGPAVSDEDIVRDWESTHKNAIDETRARVQQKFGALLPYAFISINVKFGFLVRSSLTEFQDNSMPEDVAEIMQEFVELLTYRDELENQPPSDRL